MLLYSEVNNRLNAETTKSSHLSSEENINQKMKFLDFYLQDTELVDYYDKFCYNPTYSNYCKICFKEFQEDGEMRVDCINCKICFHYVI